jgi:hypothetical protein
MGHRRGDRPRFHHRSGFRPHGRGSYQFIGTEAGDYAGFAVAAAGDVDNDGLADLIIGAVEADGGGNGSGEAYLISGADLAAADAADGSTDGVIDLDFITDPDFDRTGAGSYQFIGTEAGLCGLCGLRRRRCRQ